MQNILIASEKYTELDEYFAETGAKTILLVCDGSIQFLKLNEYFSTDHCKIIAETSKEVLASLSESRDRLSGKLCYEFHYNQRRYKYTLLRFADMIVRADVSIKKLKKRIMELDIDNRELRKQLADMERKMKR